MSVPFHGQEFHEQLGGMSPKERLDFFIQKGFPYPIARHMADLPHDDVSYAYGMHPQHPHHAVWEGITTFRRENPPPTTTSPGLTFERNVASTSLPNPRGGFHAPRTAVNIRFPNQVSAYSGNHSEPASLMQAYQAVPGMPPLPAVAPSSATGPFPHGRRETAGDVVTQTREHMGYGRAGHELPAYRTVAAALPPGGRGGIVGTERIPCPECGPFLKREAPEAEVSYLLSPYEKPEHTRDALSRDFSKTMELLQQHPVPAANKLAVPVGKSTPLSRSTRNRGNRVWRKSAIAHDVDDGGGDHDMADAAFHSHHDGGGGGGGGAPHVHAPLALPEPEPDGTWINRYRAVHPLPGAPHLHPHAAPGLPPPHHVPGIPGGTSFEDLPTGGREISWVPPLLHHDAPHGPPPEVFFGSYPPGTFFAKGGHITLGDMVELLGPCLKHKKRVVLRHRRRA